MQCVFGEASVIDCCIGQSATHNNGRRRFALSPSPRLAHTVTWHMPPADATRDYDVHGAGAASVWLLFHRTGGYPDSRQRQSISVRAARLRMMVRCLGIYRLGWSHKSNHWYTDDCTREAVAPCVAWAWGFFFFFFF